MISPIRDKLHFRHRTESSNLLAYVLGSIRFKTAIIIPHFSVALHTSKTTTTVKHFTIAMFFRKPQKLPLPSKHSSKPMKWVSTVQFKVVKIKTDNYSTTLLVFVIFARAAVLLSCTFFKIIAVSIRLFRIYMRFKFQIAGSDSVGLSCGTKTRCGVIK